MGQGECLISTSETLLHLARRPLNKDTVFKDRYYADQRARLRFLCMASQSRISYSNSKMLHRRVHAIVLTIVSHDAIKHDLVSSLRVLVMVSRCTSRMQCELPTCPSNSRKQQPPCLVLNNPSLSDTRSLSTTRVYPTPFPLLGNSRLICLQRLSI
jgi:hypothetical protein